MSLIRQSGQTLLWQIAGFLAAAVSGMLTARVLGPADRGLLAAVYLYPQLAATLGSLSLGVAIFHRLSRGTFSLQEFAGTCAAASGGLGAISLLVLLFSVWLGGEPLHRGIPWSLLLLTLLPLPCLFSLGLFSSLLQGAMDIGWYNLVNQGSKLLSLLVVLGLLALGRLRVWDLAVAGAVLTAMTGLLPVWRLHRHAPGAWRIRGDLFRSLLADGLRVHLGSIAIFLAARANLFLANAFLPKAEVGYLYMAVTLAELVWFISVAAETVLYPQVAHMTEEEAAILTARVCRQILILSVLSGLALAVLAPAAVLLYGGRAFLPAVTPLRLLLPGIVVLTISKILSALWVRRGWFLMLTVLAGGTGVLSIVLNLFLIPWLGIAGAALATTIPYLVNAGISLWIYRCRISRDVGMVWRVRWQDLVHLARSLTGRPPSWNGPVLPSEVKLP
ncbi:MAG TPA: oligosaccharide flippase family protein [Candidatus Acidoferrum sp.]|nr:oligosaccharide flippase family protein [Candidatus Acidoferrum sp.]